MLELADKDTKIVIITILHISRKLEKRWKMLYRDMENIKRTEIKLLEMKTIMSEIECTLDRINDRIDISEEKISEFKV